MMVFCFSENKCLRDQSIAIATIATFLQNEIVLHKVVYVIRRNTFWPRDMFYQLANGLRIQLI